MEEKTYVIGRGLRIFLVICTLLLAGLGITTMTIPFWDGNPDAWYIIMMAVFGLVLLIPSILGLIMVFRSRLAVTADRFILLNFIREKEMLFDDIAGFRKDNAGNLLLVPKDATRKNLGVASHFGGFDALIIQVASRWENLDAKEYAAEEERILSNRELGETRDHVKARLGFVRGLAWTLNAVAVIASLYGAFYPRPYTVVITALFIVPVAALVVSYVTRGMVTLNDEKNSPLPDVLTAFFIPLMILSLRGLLDWNFIPGGRLLFLIALCSVVLTAAVMFSRKGKSRKKWEILVVLPVMVMCSLGAVVLPNCLLDGSAPVVYRRSVQSKEITHGKATRYYLNVASWGDYDERQLSVHRELYEFVREGDTVTIMLRPGALGIPWYDVSR